MRDVLIALGVLAQALFCHAWSAGSESIRASLKLASLRGASERLSKLHKHAAAEANNVITGCTWLDADQARAGDALGLSKADRLKLRDVG